jgi:hypothetical protein
MGMQVTRIRCDDRHNEDPAPFARYYVEEPKERLIGAGRTVVESREFDEGAHSRAVCEARGSADVTEDVADQRDAGDAARAPGGP